MNGCLHEPALWPAANGERVAPDVAVHLQSCAHCSNQVAMLRDHRRQMCAACASLTPWISDAAETQAGDSGPVGTAGSRPSLRPAQIGPYAVERLLALGGQAEVYLGHHPALPDRVVIKWAYLPVTIEPRIADQFTEEARLLSEVRHPNLPRFHDQGLEDDRPFLVLEYIPGETLAARRDRRLSSPEAAALIAKVAHALQAVHEFGRLHLDIQPNNILLGQDGEPRLIDFGMSQSRIESTLYRSGIVGHGTPEYMAPEQLTGDGERIGVATDIYALGAVLHELLTGARPQPEVVWEREADRTGRCGLRTRSTQLERICRRALHPDSQRRYRTAGEFANALERVATGRCSTRLAVAGLVIAAGSALWCLQPLCPITAGRTDASEASPPVSSGERHELLAAAVHRLLSDPETRNWPASIILANGRNVPVAARPASASSTPEFADSIAAQLDRQQGTTLLLVAAQPTPLRGPLLPSGTIAHISEHGISVLAPPTVPDPSAQVLIDALGVLQRRLGQSNPHYRALVLSSITVLPRDTGLTGDPHVRHADDRPERLPAAAVVLARGADRTGPR